MVNTAPSIVLHNKDCFEIAPFYYKAAIERFQEETAQIRMETGT